MILKIKDIIGGENIYIQYPMAINYVHELIMARKKDHIIFDFSEVKFISRGFADELCAIEFENHNISIENMNDFVGTMLCVVKETHGKPKKKETINANVLEFNDMDSLPEHLKNFLDICIIFT